MYFFTKACSDSHSVICIALIIVTAVQYSCSYWNTFLNFIGIFLRTLAVPAWFLYCSTVYVFND